MLEVKDAGSPPEARGDDTLAQMLAEKREQRLIPRHDVLRLLDPVVLVGEHQQFGLDAEVLQRLEQREPLADRTAIVALAMNDQRRALPVLDEARRRIAVERLD